MSTFTQCPHDNVNWCLLSDLSTFTASRILETGRRVSSLEAAGHIFGLCYQSCLKAVTASSSRYVTIETVLKHTQTVRKSNLISVTKMSQPHELSELVVFWLQTLCINMAQYPVAGLECSGARCEWEGGWLVLTMELSRPRHCDNDATSSEHHHREYSHQAHLANSTSSSLAIL